MTPRPSHHAWVVPAAFAVLQGCTAIQWRGADGRDHHLGLVAVNTVELAAGRRVRRYSLGVDWRLSGSEPGVTLGFKRVEETAAEARQVAPAAFLRRVVQHLQAETPLTPRSPGRWHFFYYSDPVSPASVQVRSAHLGLDWRTGAEHDLAVGFASHARLTRRGTEEDQALIHLVDPRNPDHAHLTQWSIARAATVER